MSLNKIGDIKFNNGFIFLKDIQSYLFPLNSFLVLLNEILIKKDKSNVINILKNSSKIDSEIISNSIPNKLLFSQKIKFSLNILNQMGFGKIELYNISNKKIIFLLKNPVLSKFYFKLYKNKKNATICENYILGFLENILTNMIKKDINGKIISKNNLIRFELNILNDLEINKFNYLYEKNTIRTNKSNLIYNILINKQITINKGIFNIWNTFGILVPYFYLLELISFLDDFDAFFNSLGKIQGLVSVELLKSVFGIVENEKIFNYIVEQAELSATGRLKLLNKTQTQIKLKYSGNLSTYFLNYYHKSCINILENYFYSNIKSCFENSYNINSELLIENKSISLKKLKIHNKGLNQKEKEIYSKINSKNLITIFSQK